MRDTHLAALTNDSWLSPAPKRSNSGSRARLNATTKISVPSAAVTTAPTAGAVRAPASAPPMIAAAAVVPAITLVVDVSK